MARTGSSRLAVVAAAIVGAVVACMLGGGGVASAAPAPTPILTGWLPYWSTAASVGSYTANADLFTDVSPFWYSAVSGGANPSGVSIVERIGAADREWALSALRSAGKPIIPSINDESSARFLAGVLADPARRTAHVAQLLDLTTSRGFDGIDLDYERFAFSDGQATWPVTKVNWAAFVTELAAAFHARGLRVTAAVPTSPYYVYDFPTLGRELDGVRVMTYDYNVSAAGPIAPIDWVRRETTTMLQMVPAYKLMMGVPVYGRDWLRTLNSAPYITDLAGRQIPLSSCPAGTPTATKAITSANNDTVLSKPGVVVDRRVGGYDEVRARYQETYSGGGKTCVLYREAWLQDAQTITDRVQAVVDGGARGAALWTVGGEDAAQWEPIRNYAYDVIPPLPPLPPLPPDPSVVAAGTTTRIHTSSPRSTVMGNLTAVNPVAAGHLRAWPCDQPMPETSAANYSVAQSSSAFVTVATDGSGDFCVFNSGATRLVWDQSATTALDAGSRLLDTRATGAMVPSGGTVVVRTSVPAAATILGTLTVLDPQSAGHTTVWPCSQGRPATSVNNVTAPGQRTVNSTAVTTDPDGSFCIYSSMAAHLVWDAQRGAPEIQAGASQRVLDTRAGEPLAAEGELRVHAGPARATVAGNLTVVAPQGSGHTTVWTCGEQRPTASTNNFVVGETTPNFAVVRTDAAGDFCVYSTAQTHLLWDQAGAAPGFEAGSPVRLLDSVAPVPAGATIRVAAGVPNATVVGNLTVASAQTAGHTRAFPCDAPPPATSVNAFTAGETTGNFAAIRTDAGGEFCVYTAATARLVWDQVAATPATLAGAPVRLLDTRTGGGPVTAGEVRRVSTGALGSTVFGRLTVVAPSAAGHTTVWACDQPMPATSTSNFAADGRTVGNFAAVRTDAAGEFCFLSSASAHLVWDQLGRTEGFVATQPERRLDTRVGPGPIGLVPAGGTVVIATGAASRTVLGNLTVTEPQGAGHLRVWPCDQPMPTASVANFAAGETVANFLAVPTDASGSICVYAAAPAHLLFDQVSVTAGIDAHAPARILDTRMLAGALSPGAVS